MPLFTSVFSRALAAIVALCILVVGVLFARQYFDDVAVRPDGIVNVEAYRSLLRVLLILGSAVAVLVALLVYVLLSVRVAATHLAQAMVVDISFSREQFRRFYDMSPVPYFTVNQVGIIDRPNKATLRYFGLKEEELIAKNLFSFLELPEKPERISLLREQLSRRVPIDQVEVMARAKTDALRWVLLSVGDITTPGSTVHTGLVTIVDIHEQKELERIKTEFLSLASHQLRAPLANLKWYIDFLLHRRSAQFTDEVKGLLVQMNQRNEDMIDLVNTLLNLSRVEMGRVQLEKGPTDLAGIAVGIIQELLPSATEKKITIIRAFPETIPAITDARLVRIILQNLLTNAVRYTRTEGTVTVQIGEVGARYELSVTDTGVGIPPDEQEKIFSKMYRATNAKEMEATGTGIGLYMSKGLAEALGGSISFTTQLNKGTTFTFTVPKQ